MRRMILALLVLLSGCAKVTVTFGNEARKPSETTQPQPSSTNEPQENVVVMFNDGIHGTFTGEAKSRSGMVTVEVTLEAGIIDKVEVLSCDDTPVIADAAKEGIVTRVRKEQNVTCEVVSGATETSLAIQEAIKDALSKADVDPTDYCREVNKENDTWKEDEETDIVVVGAGMAGLSAAIEIKRSNPDMNVIVVEKNGYVGGSSRLAPGAIWVVNDKVNSELTADLTLGQFCANLGNDIDTDMAGNIAAKASDVLNYYLEHGLPTSKWNIKFPDTINEIPVFWSDHPEIGESGYIDALEKMAKDLGVEIRLNTAMDSLVEGNGIEGVVVHDETVSYRIKAKKVILACGGFVNNPSLIMQYANMYYNRGFSYAVGGDGSGIISALYIGATIEGKGMCGSVGVDEIHGNTDSIGSLVFAADKVINTMGEEFGYAQAKKEALLNLVHAQPGSMALGLFRSVRKDLDDARSAGYLKDYKTLDELANAYGFERSKIIGLPEGPYSVLEIKPMYYGTLAGLAVDSECRVLDKEGNPIENLYAAGELVKHRLVVEGGGFDGTGLSLAAYTGALAADTALAGIQ